MVHFESQYDGVRFLEGLRSSVRILSWKESREPSSVDTTVKTVPEYRRSWGTAVKHHEAIPSDCVGGTRRDVSRPSTSRGEVILGGPVEGPVDSNPVETKREKGGGRVDRT